MVNNSLEERIDGVGNGRPSFAALVRAMPAQLLTAEDRFAAAAGI
jgi:hypothetical protein